MSSPHFSSSLQFSAEATVLTGATVGAVMRPGVTSIGVCLELLLALLLIAFSSGAAASRGRLEGRLPTSRPGR